MREVALVGELTRVHKDRGEYDVAGFASRTKERLVTSVQRAHRGHETDSSSRAALVVGVLAPRVDRRQFNHVAEG